jgi:glyoxylase-like metal-dependent hydrolase (beta-lactamase superfamily II)
MVKVQDANVVFTGGLFWNAILPNTTDASLDPWIKTLDALERSGTVFVPGHGEVGAVGDVIAFREYLGTLRDAVAKAREAGAAGDRLASTVVPQLRQKFGRWAWFEELVKENIQDAEAELAGTKRTPTP